MKRSVSLLIALFVLGAAARMCLYTVNEREYAMVFALGELKEVVNEPGIHMKLPPPLQNVVYLDKRILTLDATGADLVQTSEKKNLLIDTFVKWRIGDPRLYWVSFQGSERAAADRLSEERSKGAAQAERIRANADRRSEVILAEAYRDAQQVKGSGDAEAAKIYADAFGRDPEFARFYRSLEAYRSSFAEKNDVMVVSPDAEFFDFMKAPAAKK